MIVQSRIMTLWYLETMGCTVHILRASWMLCSEIIEFVLGVHRLEKMLMGPRMIVMSGDREMMLLR